MKYKIIIVNLKKKNLGKNRIIKEQIQLQYKT